MGEITVKPRGPLVRDIKVPGDKSISHRALMFAALGDGESRIEGLQKGLDVTSTRVCLNRLGVEMVEEAGGMLRVFGKGLDGLTEPTDILDCGNSGTTIRLMSGLVAGHSFLSILTGDRHLRRRPMARILDPLREMGALALGRAEDTLAPLIIRGGSLRALEWKLPVASAQIKSAVLLAGLHARGTTWVDEPRLSRDHTERMLASMGVEFVRDGELRVGIVGRSRPKPVDVMIPGDPSSAAFWAAAALIIPGSKITVRGVSINPTRIGFFKLLERMGAPVEITETGFSMGEPVGDITVEYGPLTGIEVGAADVPSAIDEFPIFAVLAAVAKGETAITGAEELRHKESDRIDAVAAELSKAGVKVETYLDGMRIQGGAKLKPARFESHDDHRLAMSTGVLALAIEGGAVVNGAEAADVSYPGFWKELLG
jgi:3-phosphoshikimate 1-carboxyvinyltransferase